MEGALADGVGIPDDDDADDEGLNEDVVEMVTVCWFELVAVVGTAEDEDVWLLEDDALEVLLVAAVDEVSNEDDGNGDEDDGNGDEDDGNGEEEDAGDGDDDDDCEDDDIAVVTLVSSVDDNDDILGRKKGEPKQQQQRNFHFKSLSPCSQFTLNAKEHFKKIQIQINIYQKHKETKTKQNNTKK